MMLASCTKSKSIKMAKRLSRWIAVMFALLILVLLAGSVSAATIEEDFVVRPEMSVSIEFPVEDTGTIHAEISDFTGPLQELGLVLEYPSGATKEVWWWEVGMPVSLTHKVSEEDIKTG